MSSRNNGEYPHACRGFPSFGRHYPLNQDGNHAHGSSSCGGRGSNNPKHVVMMHQRPPHELGDRFSSASPFTILKHIAILFLTVLITVGLTTTLLILYVTIRPFSIPTYRRLSCIIGASALLDAMALLLPNMKLYLTGDSDPLSSVGVSVLVCNHAMDGDWWAMLMLARCVGLRGSIKAFLPKSIIGTTSGNANSLAGNAGGNRSDSPSQQQQHHHAAAASSMVMSASAPILHTKNGSSAPINKTSLPRNHSSSTQMHILPVSSKHASTASPTSNHTNIHSASSFNIPSNGHTGSNNNSPNHGLATNATNRKQSLAITYLNKLLDFPVISSEHTQNYVQDRNELFSLLRSFASNGVPAPIHLLLFPEGWHRHPNANSNSPEKKTTGSTPEYDRRKKLLARSVEFAKREGRPQLKHLLLPRTTGFYASLDSLREASPVVYDVTLAYRGYDGLGVNAGVHVHASIHTLLRLIQGKIPNEIFIRIKRYSMEEVLSDPNWLDKQWAAKDRLLGHFERHGNFPVDNSRGFCRHVVMDSRTYSVESSLMALMRLGMIPFTIPIILFLVVPLLWCVGWIWLAHRSFLLLFPGGFGQGDTFLNRNVSGGRGHGRGSMGMGGKEEASGNSNGGSDSAVGTPFFPATPFASPTHVASWASTSAHQNAKGTD